MERLYRLVLLSLFILGFVGAATSPHKMVADGHPDNPFASLIQDVRLAQEANEINEGHWNPNSVRAQKEALEQVEALFAADSQKQVLKTVKK